MTAPDPLTPRLFQELRRWEQTKGIEPESVEALLCGGQLTHDEIDVLFSKYISTPHPKLANKTPHAFALAHADHSYKQSTDRHPRVSPEDAVSSVFQQLVRSLKGLAGRPVGNIRGFIYSGIQRNIRQQFCRAKKREEREKRALNASPSPREEHRQSLQELVRMSQETREDLVCAKEKSEVSRLVAEYNGLQEKLIEAIAQQLTEKVRLVYELAFRDDLTPREIGQRLKLNSSTARVYLLRAIKQAKAILKKRLKHIEAIQPGR